MGADSQSRWIGPPIGSHGSSLEGGPILPPYRLRLRANKSAQPIAMGSASALRWASIAEAGPMSEPILYFFYKFHYFLYIHLSPWVLTRMTSRNPMIDVCCLFLSIYFFFRNMFFFNEACFLMMYMFF